LNVRSSAERVQLRLRAWLALLAFVGGLMLVAFDGHALADDAACGDAGFGRPTAGAQIDAPRTSDSPQHCELCHWQRSVAGACVSSPVTVVLAEQPRSFALPEKPGFPQVASLDRQPARAPPSLTLA
jgi:hypothetical protein